MSRKGDIMTEKMELMRREVFSAIVNGFPKEYLDILFNGNMHLEDFVNEVLVEFIKYSFDNSQEKHSLRYFVPYSVE